MSVDPVPRKKKSFLRRLSLSGHSRPEVVPNAHARSVTGPVGRPPTSYRNGSANASANANASAIATSHAPAPVPPPVPALMPASIPNGVPIQEMSRMAISPNSSYINNRGRIHPALASPPNSPPKRSSMTPYDTRHITNGDEIASGSRFVENMGTSSRSEQRPEQRPPPAGPGPAPVSPPRAPGPTRPFPTRPNTTTTSTSPPVSFSPVRPVIDTKLSEASQYARAMSRQPSRTSSQSPPVTTTSPLQRKTSRPLPRPPSTSSSPVGQTSPSKIKSFPSFDFGRSPTLPNLVDPRRKGIYRPQKLSFGYILSISRIQRHLLPFLSVNSFLALVGTTERIRKAFTGETVGKWVLREWGLRLEGEKGRSWPNLTVWEGFLESQIHDPATYSTYPAQWHKLLQHLCLSYSLIVLYLRALPPSILPPAEDEDDRPAREMRNDRLVEIVMPSPLSGTATASSRRRTSTGPPISYPTPKRYNFHSNDSARTRRSSDSRPGSIFTYQSSPSVAPSMPRHRLIRDSVASDPGRMRIPSPAPRRIEPLFDRPPPYVVGRAAVLRVFVPLSERVPRWPSAEGAFYAAKELEKCGALKKMKLGDLVANTAIKSPRTTEHILMYDPASKHALVPLEYSKSQAGHLPSYIDAFTLPPMYYHPLLSPIIVCPNLAPYAPLAMSSLRLAYDHKDVIVSTGRASAKRYIHVTGFEVASWGMVTLEADGTGEGKAELERRLGYGDPSRIERSAWEVVREKSMTGTVWLRCV